MAISSIIVTLTIAGVVVSAKEKVCSRFCNSVGMLQSFPGKSYAEIYQSKKTSRGVSDTSKADCCTCGWTRVTTPGDLPRVVCHIAIVCIRGEVILSE